MDFPLPAVASGSFTGGSIEMSVIEMGLAVGSLFLSHLEVEIYLEVFSPISNVRLKNRISNTKVYWHILGS